MSSAFEEVGGEEAMDAAVGALYRKVPADNRAAHFSDDVDMDRQAAKQKAFLTILLTVGFLAAPASAQSDSISSQAPIHYDTSKPDDAVARLQQQIDTGRVKLSREDSHGYLESVLKWLKIPASSQTLVFSKTSFQRDLISPSRPRALYFNDDAYIGFVQGGEVLEAVAVDKQLGPVFYTLDQQSADKPRFLRQTDNCLQCHESSMTQNVPGLIVRSVYPEASGMPLFSAGTFRTTDGSPFKERYGGWYVSGTHGSQRHMGNLIVRSRDDPDNLDLNRGANVTDLAGRLDTSPYLAKTSDIVALMVLTHQTQIHNLLTNANYQTRLALRDQQVMNHALNEKPDHVFESTGVRIEGACEPLVRAMLFCDAAPLTDRITGSSTFAEQFAAAGPRDPAGRSLRDFDLQKRLFKYPCSFLIYSESFAALPGRAKEWIYQRLWDILTGKEKSRDFAALSTDDRKAIREVLAATVKDLPGYWK